MLSYLYRLDLFSTEEGPESEDNTYLGYSLTLGHFDGMMMMMTMMRMMRMMMNDNDDNDNNDDEDDDTNRGRDIQIWPQVTATQISPSGCQGERTLLARSQTSLS